MKNTMKKIQGVKKHISKGTNLTVKKIKQNRSNPRSSLLRSSTLGLIIQITANFALALSFKAII